MKNEAGDQLHAFRAHLIKFSAVAWLSGGHWGLTLPGGEADAHDLGTIAPDNSWDPYVWRSIQILPGLCGILTVPILASGPSLSGTWRQMTLLVAWPKLEAPGFLCSLWPALQGK